MSGIVTFTVRDAATGALNPSAAPAFANPGGGLEYRDVVSKALRTPPTVYNLGGGEYGYLPTDDDEATGVAALIDTGAGNEPRYISFSIHLGDNSNQRWVWHHEDEAGGLWPGASPTIPSYADRTGGARTAPTPDATAGAYLWSATPSAGDVTIQCGGVVAGPAGAIPESLSIATSPVIASPWPAPSPGPLKNPALDLVSFLDAKDAGDTTLDAGTNLFAGIMRRKDRTASPAVFVLNTGGPSPAPYLGGDRQSMVRAMVQVMIRSAENDFEAGEAMARGVLEWLQQQDVPGYIACYARDSQPAFLGEDSQNHYSWSINLELQYKAELG